MKRPPRMDKPEKVNVFSYDYLEQVASETKNAKIIIAKHNLETQGLTREEIYGLKSDKCDGIHLSGKKGKLAMNNSIENIIQKHIVDLN